MTHGRLLTASHLGCPAVGYLMRRLALNPNLAVVVVDLLFVVDEEDDVHQMENLRGGRRPARQEETQKLGETRSAPLEIETSSPLLGALRLSIAKH